jgi:WD40 repeat protein
MAIQGAQYGGRNEQRNYFAPVTQNMFTGSFERLKDACFDPAPLARDLDLARFTGRGWLISQIDAFIKTRPRGYVIIQAEAGVGKSALAAHLAGTRAWLHHFTRLPGGRSPEAARKSLAVQLIARWGLLEEWAPGGMLPDASARPDWFCRLLEAAACSRDTREPGEPVVLVIDGLDEAETETSAGLGLPLGLPDSLPDKVFVVATSRFGIDHRLHAIRNPADWLQIEVEGPDNLADMRRFIGDVTNPDSGDARLIRALDSADVDVRWFRSKMADVCAGVWIYLRYVLDEFRDGTRDPRSVGDLPGDLAGYYAGQVQSWRGLQGDESAERRWEQVRLPLLGVLATARAPLTAGELAKFAGLMSVEAARAFIEESARAFLNRDDGQPGQPRYALRHQSLRDLLTGIVPTDRQDLAGMAGMLAEQARVACRHITGCLIPAGEPGERNWGDCSTYAKRHLAAHAAACGVLDDLACDPGFLLIADPDAVLAQRGNLHSADGKRALAAFDLTLEDRQPPTPRELLTRLAANAARVRATALTTACASGTADDWPIRWAAWNGQPHRSLSGHGGEVHEVAIGEAGGRTVIISGSSDRTVRIWDAVTYEPTGEPLAGHRLAVNAVAIGMAGGREVIASGSSDRTVRIWDAVTGEPVGKPLVGHSGAVFSVAIGEAGGRTVIISGSSDRTVRIWDAVTGDPVREPLVGHKGPVYAVAVGQAGGRTIIASGSDDQTVRIWDAATGQTACKPLADHDGAVFSVAVGPAGVRDVVVSGSDDHTVRIWDATTGEPAGEPLVGHYDPVNSVTLGRLGDREVIISSSYDNSARVWDAVTGDPIGEPLAGHHGAVNSVVLGQAGGREVIISCSDDRTVRIWDAAIGGPVGEPLPGHLGEVRTVAIGRARDREVIASGSYDRTVRIWDAATGDPIGEPLVGHDDWVQSVAMGHARGLDVIVSGSIDRTVRIWDAVTGDPIGEPLVGHDGPVYAVTAGRAGDREIIVSGSDDRTVRVWDAITGELIGQPLVGHNGAVISAAVGRVGDREIIVSGSDDRTVRVWDAVTGDPIGRPLAGHDHAVYAVALGQAGNRDVLVSGSIDRTVRVWDAVTGEPIGQPLCDGGPVYAVAIGYAGDREIIVSGSDDRTVRVWDAVTGKLIGQPLAGHNGLVYSVAMGHFGDREVIISGSGDRTVMVRENRRNDSNHGRVRMLKHNW